MSSKLEIFGKKLDHTLNNKTMHPIIEQKVSKGSPAPTNLVFPLPVGPIIAFKPGNIIPLKVSIRINHYNEQTARVCNLCSRDVVQDYLLRPLEASLRDAVGNPMKGDLAPRTFIVG